MGLSSTARKSEMQNMHMRAWMMIEKMIVRKVAQRGMLWFWMRLGLDFERWILWT